MMFLSKFNFTWRMKLHLVDELIMVRTAGCRRRSSNCCLTWVSSYPSSPLTEYLVVISYLITSAQLFCFVQSGNWTVQDTWSSNSISDPESYMRYTLWGVCPFYSVKCLKNTIEPMSSAFWKYTNYSLADQSLLSLILLSHSTSLQIVLNILLGYWLISTIYMLCLQWFFLFCLCTILQFGHHKSIVLVYWRCSIS